MFLPKHAALFLSIAMRNIQGYNLRSLHSNNQEKIVRTVQISKHCFILFFCFFCFLSSHFTKKKTKNTEVDISL